MMTTSLFKLSALFVVIGGVALTVAQVSGQQKGDPTRHIPVPPEIAAKRLEAGNLTEQGARLVREGKLQAAIGVLEEAAVKEDEAFGHGSSAKFELAQVFQRLGQNDQALDAYRRAFKWDPSRGDLTVNGPDPVRISMNYAILLAKNGKAEEAKAIYYYGLRVLNSPSNPNRFIEPVPFLVVFDEDKTGSSWTYTPEALEAAAGMALIMRGQTGDVAPAEMLKRVSGLAPQWFYPVLWKAAHAWRSPEGPALVAQAKILARPGVEQRLMRQYELDLAAHKAAIKANDTPLAEDERPIREGVDRRAKMESLKPNLEILKRVSVGG